MSALTPPPAATWTAQLGDQAATLGFRLIVAAVTGLILWALYWLTRRAVRRAVDRTATHANARLLIDRCVQFGFLFLGLTWMLSVLGVPLTAFVAVVGAISLAVSLALQDVLKNLVAGMIILIERPFTIGEHIDFKTFSGVVETIELRTTVLRTPTGQRVVIPNAMIFSEALVNRSAYGRQLVRLRVTIPLEEPDEEPHEEPEADAGERLAGEVLRAVSDGVARPDVLVESLTREKVTLRVETWTGDAREAVPRLAWALRRRLPGAEITVLE